MVGWIQGRNIMAEGHGRSKLLISWYQKEENSATEERMRDQR